MTLPVPFAVMKTTLWKISVILSALHLIVSKRGPIFEWSGSEGVAAHLKSSGAQGFFLYLSYCKSLKGKV